MIERTRAKILVSALECQGPGLHSAGPTPPSLLVLPARRTFVGIVPCWEPMWQHLVKIIIIQVDITFIIPKLVDGVPSHAKATQWLKWPGVVTLVPNEGEFACRCGQEDRAVKEAWEGQGPAEWRCDPTRDHNSAQVGIEFNHFYSWDG